MILFFFQYILCFIHVIYFFTNARIDFYPGREGLRFTLLLFLLLLLLLLG
jgi:hypothetical protein